MSARSEAKEGRPPRSCVGAEDASSWRLARRSSSIALRLTRLLALPAMAAALGLYVVVHSPLNRALARLAGLSTTQCYPCGGTLGAERVAESLAALTLLALALLAAAAVAAWQVDVPEERPLAFGLLALAFVVVPSAALGAIGTAFHAGLLRPPLGPLVCATPAGVVVAFAAVRGSRPRLPRLPLAPAQGLVRLIALLGGGMVLAAACISLFHPPTQGDALSYHAPLAVFLWSDGNLSAFLDRSPDIWALAHPGTAELWFGLLRVAGGERLADLGQLPFALLAALAVGVFARRLGLWQGAAVLAACAFLVGPLVVMQAGMQANDLTAAALLMATMALACAPVPSWDRRRLALIGLGLGLTATTKVALLPSVAAVALFVVVALTRQLRRRDPGKSAGRPGRSAGRLLVAAGAFALVVAPWWGRDIVRFHNPFYPGNLPFAGHGVSLDSSSAIDGEFVPRRVAWPLYPLLEPHDDRSGVGALFVVGAVPGFVVALLRARRQPLLLYLTVALLSLPAWWLYTLHEPRFLLAFFGLGFAFLPWSLLLLRTRRRPVGVALLAAAAVFSTMVTLDQALVPFAHQPTARSTFYDRVWGVDPAVSSLPSRDGILLNTGYGPSFSDYAAYYPLLGGSYRPRRVVVVDASGADASTAGLVATMRRRRLRFAYLSVVPSMRKTVAAVYDPRHFRVVRVSGIEVGERTGVRRYLYRDVPPEVPGAIRRYLFELR